MLDFGSVVLGGVIAFISSLGITWFGYYLQKTGCIRAFSFVEKVYDPNPQQGVITALHRVSITFDLINDSFSPKCMRNPKIIYSLQKIKKHRNNASCDMYVRNDEVTTIPEILVNFLTTDELFDRISIIQIPPRSTKRYTADLVFFNALQKTDRYYLVVAYVDEKNRTKRINAGQMNF